MHKFLGDVLPDTGHYRLVLVPVEKGQYAQTLWASSIEELASFAEQHAERTRVYYGSASYRERTKGDATNVLLNKALRLDIDAGEAKLAKHGPDAVYATQRDALIDLRRFIIESGLKPSYVVSSGEGLHVYYCLEQPLEREPWEALAERLARLCVAHGFKADPAVTTDATRLLRPVGVKHENGSEVRVLSGKGTPLTAEALDAALPGVPTFTDDDLAENDAFLESFESGVEHPPASALKIAEKCASLREVAKAGGDVPEPLWRAMLGLVKHTVEGDNLAHQWSEGYEHYDERETQKKIDLWRTGPTTCDEFAKHCSSCASCPHRGKIKSPIALGRLNDEEQAELPPEQQTTLAPPKSAAAPDKPWSGMLPDTARVVETEDGDLILQYMQKKFSKDEDGKHITTVVWVPVSRTVFWFSRWGEANSAEDSAQAVLCVWMGRYVKTYEVSQVALSAPAKLIEMLSSKAVHLTNHQLASKAAHEYAKEQFVYISAKHKNLRVTDRFGMRILDDGELVAVHGRYTIHGDGVIRDTIMPADLRSVAEGYTIPLPEPATPGVWTPEVWDTHIIPAARRYVEFVNRRFGKPGYEPFQLAIAMSVASPVMPFIKNTYYAGDKLPTECAMSVSLYSRSGGRGKTTAAQVGLLAYGRPDNLMAGGSTVSTTDLARVGRLSITGTMPSVMDEVGDLSRDQVFKLLYTVANGSGRGRLTRGGVVIPSPAWALINVLTTNYSLTDLLSDGSAGGASVATGSDAVHRRILEIDVGDVPDHSVEERLAFAREYGEILRTCAGALGAVLQREIARAGVEGIHTLVQRQVENANNLAASGQADRFMYRALGAMFTSNVLLHRAGLDLFEMPTLIETFKQAHLRSLEAIQIMEAAASPLETLARCLRELAPHTVITNEETRGGRNVKTFDTALNLRMPDMIHGRHVKALGITYMSVDALRAWTARNRVNLRDLIAAADREGVLVRARNGPRLAPYTRKVLTTGMAGSTGEATPSYTFNVHRLSGLLDREDEDAPPSVTNVYLLETGERYQEQLAEGAEEPAVGT